MKVTFLGTGTSQGIPIIGCKCAVCTSANEKDNRLRTSILIEKDDKVIVVDTGPDFRQQMLRQQIGKLDAILFTHSHKDHVAGMDDIRAYNYLSGKAMEVYATEETQVLLKKEFDYVFTNKSYPGIPQVNLNTINAKDTFTVCGIDITPIRVLHYKMEVLGFRIDNFTYITDANYIASEEMSKIQGSKALVLNALRHEKHISHFTLNEAIDIATTIDADNTYFTHISHQLGMHDDVTKILPSKMHLAYDGLTISL